MDFISNRQTQIQEMLKVIGVKTIKELFQMIPEELYLNPIDEEDGLSEFEGIQLMEKLAAKNSFSSIDNYLGAGAYEHHVPSLVGAVCSRSEFLTSYTPYQAEASQGMLQAIFEFQSSICALTGLNVANASLYDGSSACAEAVLMAMRCQKNRNKVVIAKSLHPHYRSVGEQYLISHGTEIVDIPFLDNGLLDMKVMNEVIDDKTAAVLVSYPNFFGVIDELKLVSDRAKSVGALTIICADLLVYGLFKSAAELGADIAIGDCQSLGLSLNFGGPYAGYMSCQQEFLRQMPGRLVGETVDLEGNRGFVLTLQTREQHIRREKATSNICTNQALAALACLVTILWYGRQGLKELALTNFQRANYLKSQLELFPEIKSLGKSHIFNEFAITFSRPANQVLTHFHKYKIEPGLHLGPFFPHLKDYFLIAVTETKNLTQLNHYIEVTKALLKG